MGRRYDYYRCDRVHDRLNHGRTYRSGGECETGVNWKGERVPYVPCEDMSGNLYDAQFGTVYENEDPELMDEDGNQVPLGATIFEERFEERGWAAGPFVIDDSIVDEDGNTVMDLLEDSYVGDYFMASGEAGCSEQD